MRRIDRPQTDEWALTALARRTYSRFHEEWRAVPENTRRRFLAFLLGGWLLGVLLTLVLVGLVRRLEGSDLLWWDTAFLEWLGAQPLISFSAGMWMETLGNSVVVVPLAIFAGGWAAWNDRPLRALAFVVSVPAYKLLVGVGWFVWRRARPLIVENGLGAPEGWSSFPSGHVVQTTVVYGLLVYLWMQKTQHWGERLLAALFLLGVIACSGIGRMRTGAHWPTDVLAGLIVGGAWLAVVILALRTTMPEE